jgi:hypothetical protein
MNPNHTRNGLRTGSYNIERLVWSLLSSQQGRKSTRKLFGIRIHIGFGLAAIGLFMSDRTKLTIASLSLLMLPYRIDFPIICLVVTAAICTAIDMAMDSRVRVKGLVFSWLAALRTAVSTMGHYPIASSPRGYHAGRTGSDAP